MLLVGAGVMAQEYARILLANGIEPVVICRSSDSATAFEDATGVTARAGGVDAYLRTFGDKPVQAIVAVGVEQLFGVSQALILAGMKSILVEKPAGLNSVQITELQADARNHGCKVWVAYNRRFYTPVQKAREILAEDGGVRGFSFEITEWSSRIAALPKSRTELEHWFLANSSHVVDLAFFLGGEPGEIVCHSDGALPWHSRSSRFAGAGVAVNGALFSYHGDWEAPGRWSVQVWSKRHRIYLSPMEELHIQKTDSVRIDKMDLDGQVDQGFKPGLYRQVVAFIQDETEFLCSLETHADRSRIYEKMAGYGSSA